MASDETYIQRGVREQREEQREYFQLQYVRYIKDRFIYLVLKSKTQDETSLKGTLLDSIVLDGDDLGLLSEGSIGRCCDFAKDGPLAETVCVRCSQGTVSPVTLFGSQANSSTQKRY